MSAGERIVLTREEYSAVVQLAILDLRSIPDELHFLVRSELEKRGSPKAQDEPSPTIEMKGKVNL